MVRAKRLYIPGYRGIPGRWGENPPGGMDQQYRVGSRSFVEHVKALLGFRAKGKDVTALAERK